MFWRDRIEYKTPDQVLTMRRAGLVVADALDAVRAVLAPGVTTAELDAVAYEVIAGAGATPSFLGYHDYPATLCVSVNDQVVHGIPGGYAVRDGDLVSVDCGAVVDGWHGDSAFTAVVGEAADARDVALGEATRGAMWAGIAALARGSRLGEVGEAVEAAAEAHAERAGCEPYGLIREYVGHGIGTAMHQPPEVLNYRARDRGPALRPGLCVAIEPMLTRGSAATHVLEDEWTVVTADGSRAAHWEHTVALLDDGVWVLTARDGGAAELAEHGVEVAAP